MEWKNLSQVLCDLSQKHIKFKTGGYCDLIKFDQNNKRIWSGNTTIYDNGKVIDRIELDDGTIYETKDLPLTFEIGEDNGELKLAILQLWYGSYKASIPNRHTTYAKSNFKAKQIYELTTKEMMEGNQRNLARVMLESFVMFNDFNFLFEKPEHWFWQDKEDKDLIIHRNWASITI